MYLYDYLKPNKIKTSILRKIHNFHGPKTSFKPDKN